MKRAFVSILTGAVLFVSPAEAARYESFGSSAPWLSVAKSHVGSGPRQLGVRRNLWCAAGVNKFLRAAGYRGTGSDAARSFARYGTATGPVPGAIAVMRRGRNGGHVAIVVKDLGDRVLTVSPNSGNRVKYVAFRKSRIYAYRWPA